MGDYRRGREFRDPEWYRMENAAAEAEDVRLRAREAAALAAEEKWAYTPADEDDLHPIDPKTVRY